MTESLIQKLETLFPLADEDKCLIASVTQRFDLAGTEADIMREGDAPGDLRLIATGLAFRYKLLESGQRQIIGFLFPGDICDLHAAAYLDVADHSIAALSPCRVVRITTSDISALLKRPAIARALLMVTLIDGSIGRDWLANIGGRRAEQRLAHLFCEWHIRSQLPSCTRANECEFPLTQVQIGELLGVSNVHANRLLQRLRTNSLIDLRNKRLTILDEARLWRYCGYNDKYLHRKVAI